MGDSGNIKKKRFFVAAMCTLCVLGTGSVVAKVYCNDRAVPIYIDGVNVGSTASHMEVWSGTVDETARVIAVDCENRAGGGALIVSFSNGFISDERWKCSGTEVPGWYDINFDDSGWKAAYIIKINGAGNSWPGRIAKIADDAKWIWKDTYFATSYTHSYCRAHIECGCEYKCDMMGDLTCFCPDGYSLNNDNRTCSDERTSISAGLIVSISLNVILVVALIVLVIIIVKRRNTVEGRERERTQTHLELAAGAMGPTELKRESQHAPSTDNAINTDYEKVDNAGPYESLAPTVQYANANVSPYEGLH